MAARSRFSDTRDIDDLAVLVDRPIQMDPAPSNFDIALVDEPPITRRVTARLGRSNWQRSELLHPNESKDETTTLRGGDFIAARCDPAGGAGCEVLGPAFVKLNPGPDHYERESLLP